MTVPTTKFLGSPYLQDPDLTIWNGDVREILRSLPDESVQMCVTSPPYWGLRDYGADGQIGLEATPESFVATMVEVFREVRRVLRKDGTMWLNLGDSYNSGTGAGRQGERGQMADRSVVGARLPGYWKAQGKTGGLRVDHPGLKVKDLCMIPARVALALQADGWYLRSEITWCKPNPMPESVTDRPTQATEKVYLFSRSPRYFYDAEAVREPHARLWDERNGGTMARANHAEAEAGRAPQGEAHRGPYPLPNPAGRNLRNWWEIATEPYPEAHFATYPQELVRRCILAGTSERGCCPECGAPWVREVERVDTGQRQKMGDGWDTGSGGHGTVHRDGREKGEAGVPVLASVTTGWQPTCDHMLVKSDRPGLSAPRMPDPCTILDPFFGSGTTGLVGRKHGRKTIGIELSPEYCALAARRLSQLSLLAEGAA